MSIKINRSMPKCCEDCSCLRYNLNFWCGVTGKYLNFDVHARGPRPNDCMLEDID